MLSDSIDTPGLCCSACSTLIGCPTLFLSFFLSHSLYLIHSPFCFFQTHISFPSLFNPLFNPLPLIFLFSLLSLYPSSLPDFLVDSSRWSGYCDDIMWLLESRCHRNYAVDKSFFVELGWLLMKTIIHSLLFVSFRLSVYMHTQHSLPSSSCGVHVHAERLNTSLYWTQITAVREDRRLKVELWTMGYANQLPICKLAYNAACCIGLQSIHEYNSIR